MYFNENKENTNIDNEFSKTNNVNFSSLKTPLIIVGAIILFIILVVIVALLMNRKPKYYLSLIGDSEISIYQGSTYYELGYKAHDNHKKDLSSEVEVKNNIDSGTIGTYMVIYTLYDQTAKRVVNVIEAPEKATYIHLYGGKEVIVSVGEEFVDEYEAIDAIDGDITQQVTKNGTVDTSKEGTYTVVYSVTNSQGVTTTEARTVTVR